MHYHSNSFQEIISFLKNILVTNEVWELHLFLCILMYIFSLSFQFGERADRQKFMDKNMTETRKFKTSTYRMLGSGCGSERPLSPWPAFCIGDGGSRRWNINGVRFCVRYNMAYSRYQASRWEKWGDGIQSISGANGIRSINNTRQSSYSARRHSGIWSLLSQWNEPMSQAIRRYVNGTMLRIHLLWSCQ